TRRAIRPCWYPCRLTAAARRCVLNRAQANVFLCQYLFRRCGRRHRLSSSQIPPSSLSLDGRSLLGGTYWCQRLTHSTLVETATCQARADFATIIYRTLILDLR